MTEIRRETKTMEPGQKLPTVAVLGLGGTIASSAGTRDSWLDYGAPGYHIADIVGYLEPELSPVVTITADQVLAAGSSTLSIADLALVSGAVREALETADAVVVASGSDALEEVAYWLDLTVPADRPVVVTGSMRPFALHRTGEPREQLHLVHGTDGPANLLSAIKLAASGATAGLGCVVVFGDRIHAARDVVKRHATLPDPFESPGAGPLGYMLGGEPVLHRTVLRPPVPDRRTPVFDLADRDPDRPFPRVEIVLAYPGGGGESVEAFEAAGVRGIAIECMGSGAVHEALATTAEAAAARDMVFVFTTRTGSGSVKAPGAWGVTAGDLGSTKARLLTILLLDVVDSADEVARRLPKLAMPSLFRAGS